MKKGLNKKLSLSKDIIQKAYAKFLPAKTAVAWTGGKDSTVLLHIIRTTFDNTFPFQVMFNDSTMEFKEIYQFIQNISHKWKLNLITVPHNSVELKKFHQTKDKHKKLELSRIMKIHALENFQKTHKIQAFLAGIRWDEHESRSKEKYFSKRESHTRIHPLLHFTEADIWDYIHAYNVPYVTLYNKGYRSLGEKPFTKKSKPGQGERSGREPDKERLMEKLRSMGYW
jgi:phosphoadenosine phosphosulfate reductase